MRSDAALAAYLDNVSEYQELKQEAAQQWKDAFIGLTKARISGGAVDAHDAHAPARLTARGLALHRTPDESGAWTSQTLAQARAAFARALESELACCAFVRRARDAPLL